MLNWIGLTWDFEVGGMKIMSRRIAKTEERLLFLKSHWPNVTFRDVSRFLGQLVSMTPVLEGQSSLHSRMLQLIVNIRHYYKAYWDDKIFVDTNADILFNGAKEEIDFWIKNLSKLNFRPFKLKQPESIGWTDASGKAAGGLVCKLKPNCESSSIVTADNLLIPVEGDKSVSFASLQNSAAWRVAEVCKNFNKKLVKVRDNSDLDLNLVDSLQFVHRMFTKGEIKTDSNFREMIGVKELLIGSENVIKNSIFVLYTDNMNVATILKNGSNKYRLHEIALFIDKLCSLWGVTLRPVWIPRYSDI